MSLQARFQQAADKVTEGKVGSLSQNEQLDLYGLYAVVKKGAAPKEGPSAFLDPRGFAKWTAWTAESHLSKEEAMEKYIQLVAQYEGGRKDGGSGGSDAFGMKASSGFNITSENGESELDMCYWATMGDVKSVKHCLEQLGVDVNYRDKDGLTALMRAVDRNEEMVVDVLVNAGADLNATDEEGQTALHYAAYCEHAEMTGLLVSYGAKTDIKDKDGMTAVDAATGETAKVLEKAIKGAWKRSTAPYTDITNRELNIGLTEIAIGACALTLLGLLILRYRYKR